jgi:hypothetical protein
MPAVAVATPNVVFRIGGGDGIHFLRGLIQPPPVSRESRIRMALAQLYVVLFVYIPMASNIMPIRSRMGERVRSLVFMWGPISMDVLL